MLNKKIRRKFYGFFLFKKSLYLCIMKNELKNIEKAAQRKIAIEAGFYDGRFMNRVIPNKKKQESKRRIKVDKHFD